MEDKGAKSSEPPSKEPEPEYPKLSETRMKAFLEDFKQGVEAGAVNLAPGNTVETGDQPFPAPPKRRTANPAVVAWLHERMKAKDRRDAAMRLPTGRIQ